MSDCLVDGDIKKVQSYYQQAMRYQTSGKMELACDLFQNILTMADGYLQREQVVVNNDLLLLIKKVKVGLRLYEQEEHTIRVSM